MSALRESLATCRHELGEVARILAADPPSEGELVRTLDDLVALSNGARAVLSQASELHTAITHG